MNRNYRQMLTRKGDHRGNRGKIIPEFHGMEERFLSGGLFRVMIFVCACSLLWNTGLFAQRVKVTDTIHWYNNRLETQRGKIAVNTKKDAVWERYQLPDEVQQVLEQVLPGLKIYWRGAPFRPSTKDYLFKMRDTTFRKFDDNYLRCLIYESYHKRDISAENMLLAWFYIQEMSYLMDDLYVLDSVRLVKHDNFQIEGNDFNYEISYLVMFNHHANRVYKAIKSFFYIDEEEFIRVYYIKIYPKLSWGSAPADTSKRYYKFPPRIPLHSSREMKDIMSEFSLSCIDIQNSSFYEQYLGYHYFMVESNGYPTEVQCSFLVQGLSTTQNNYRLKVFSDGIFYSQRVIFESDLTYSSTLNGFVSQVFLPGNNEYDGFFSVEVFNSNGTPVAGFPPTTIVLERIRTDVFPGSSPQQFIELHYVKSFFNLASSATIPDCDEYCTMVIDQLKEAWVTQLPSGADKYGFGVNLIGSQPLNSSDVYHVSLNANYKTDKESRFYWHDNGSSNWASTSENRMFSFSTDLYESVTTYKNYVYTTFMRMVINHEFFHAIQYSYNPTFFLTSGSLDYDFLVEGQARFIETIVNDEELDGTPGMYKMATEKYISWCNEYSLNMVGYDYALFWRYLYEHYNNTGSQDLTSQLSIIREMMSGYYNPDIASIEAFMDSKLNSGNIDSMDDVIKMFAKAVCFNDEQYGLWTDGGDDLYIEPDIKKLSYDGTEIDQSGTIPASFGLDYVEIEISTAGSVLITVNANLLNSGSPMTLYANLIEITPTGLGDDQIIDLSNGANSVIIENCQIGQRYMVILARLDNREEELWGTGFTSYEVKVGPLYDPTKLRALFKVIGGKGSTVQFVNLPVGFEDLSIPGTSPILSWEWSFPGGNPATSALQNPTVEYLDPGYYGVGLTVRNQTEVSTLFISDYITVLDPSLNSGGTNNPWITFYHNQLGLNLISLHINISGGIPPFHVSYQKDGANTLVSDWTYETSFIVLVPSVTGNNVLTVYVDSEDPGGGGNAVYQYYIGNPGEHSVAVDYTYAGLNPSQPVLGVYTPVTFTDLTTGGFKPYMQWEWIWGNELATGVAPIPSSGPPWEIIGNSYFNPDPGLLGNPSKTIEYPQAGVYPVTLNVIDFAGFCNSTTVNIEVGQACQCLTLKEIIKDGGDNFNVHSNKVRMNGSPTVFLHNFTPEEFFNCYYPGHWCQAQTSDSPQYDDRSITDFRWKLFRNGSFVGEETHSMPSTWAANHPGYWDTWVGSQSISQQSFSYTFTTKGRYELYFDAKNRREHPQGMNTLNFNNQTNYHMYDAVLHVIQAIDCNEVIEINQDIADANPDVNYSGEYIFASLNPVNFQATAQQAYEACTAINMRPGFTITYGSTFTGKIDPIVNTPGKSTEEIAALFDENIPNGSTYTVYPNPNQGVFTIRCSTDSFLEDEGIEITNAVGQRVDFVVTESGNEKKISITHPVPGFCIIRIRDTIGQVHCHKAVII